VCFCSPRKQFPLHNRSIHPICQHPRTIFQQSTHIHYESIHNLFILFTSSATAVDAVSGLSSSTYVFSKSLGSGCAFFIWIVKSSMKLNLANCNRIATTCSLNSGCLFKPNSVVLSPPFSDTNQSQEAVRRLPSPNSKANLENNLAVHYATSKLLLTSPGFNAFMVKCMFFFVGSALKNVNNCGTL